jgi:hypothetical protein
VDSPVDTSVADQVAVDSPADISASDLRAAA